MALSVSVPRRGEAERAALGVAADCPMGARMDYRPAERADPLQRGLKISDGEVRQRDCVAWPGAALVHAHGRRIRMCLPPASLRDRAVLEFGSEKAGPEPQCALSVVRGKLDQGQPHAHCSHNIAGLARAR